MQSESISLKYKVLTTFVSCGLIAVCGVFYANYIRFINPDIMIQAQSVEFVLPAVIGGIGRDRPLIGAIILTPLSSSISTYPEQYSAPEPICWFTPSF